MRPIRVLATVAFALTLLGPGVALAWTQPAAAERPVPAPPPSPPAPPKIHSGDTAWLLTSSDLFTARLVRRANLWQVPLPRVATLTSRVKSPRSPA